MKIANIYQNLPENLIDESFDSIVKAEKTAIERIVSRGHSSPPNFWYDQEDNEWVLLLQGRACLLFEEGNEKVVLNPGDHITISAHVRHRVEWTDPKTETLWLAVYY